MAEAFNLEKYSGQVQRTAVERLSAATGPDDLVKMMEMVTYGAEGELAAHGDGGKHIACRAGCGTCCAVNVAVLFPEVIAIVDFVRTKMAPEKQRVIVRRVAELFRKVSCLDEEERISLRQSCAFLDEVGSCSIYPVRPLICRAITSIDAQDCEEALHAVTTGMEHPIYMNMFQKSLMEETFIAVAEGLTQLGFDDSSGQLTVGVQRLLERPELADCFIERKYVWNEQGAGG
jgi:Fe-S-cluster containining protein